MEARTNEPVAGHGSPGKNLSPLNARNAADDMMRLLQGQLDKNFLSELTKYYRPFRLMMEREVAKSNILFEGLRAFKKLPEAVFVLDTITDKIALTQTRLPPIPPFSHF